MPGFSLGLGGERVQLRSEFRKISASVWIDKRDQAPITASITLSITVSKTRPIRLILTTFVPYAVALVSHLPVSGASVELFLSSTWGRADQQTSHDSLESGAFCFA
jgi:hypothetical protein